MSGFDIRLQRVVDAAPQAVFHHWVDPVARRGWYAPEDGWIVEAETDLRIGGAWSVSFGPTRCTETMVSSKSSTDPTGW